MMKTTASTEKGNFGSWTPFFLLICPSVHCREQRQGQPPPLQPCAPTHSASSKAPVPGEHICAPSHLSSSNTLQRQQIHELKALVNPGRITAAATRPFPVCLCWVRGSLSKKTPFATEKPLVCAARGEPSHQGSLSRVFILSHHKLTNSSLQCISLSSAFWEGI